MSDAPSIPVAAPHRHKLSTFWLAYAASLTSISLFVLWAFLDNSFYALTGGEWVYWDELAARYVLFVLLASCGLASTLVVFFCLGIGNPADRSLKGLLAAVALIGAWLCLGLNHDRIAWNGFVWHWQRMVPHLKEDAKELSSRWPVADGQLPHLGTFEAIPPAPGSPAYLFCDNWSPGFKFNHTVSHIHQGPNGRIFFDLGKFPEMIEYCPSPCESDRDGYFEWAPGTKRFELEPMWYLVWHNDVGSLGPK